jgi:hypothetical protein
MAGGLITLVWCFIVFFVALWIEIPNLSQFPEIDIASKVVQGETDGSSDTTTTFTKLLSPLSNAGSIEIRKRLAFSRFYVRFSNDETPKENQRLFSITLEEM